MGRWFVLLSFTTACRIDNTFVCATSEQCGPGTCEPLGFCSFPDSSCSSGQRYDISAGSGLSNQCVDALRARSCKELLARDPATPSGMYAIDLDGPDGASLQVYCDMTTAPVGEATGGWTLIFIPTSSSYDTTTLDYSTYSSTLLNEASEALLANRTASLGIMGTTASFPLPSDWRAVAPFKAGGVDSFVSVTLTEPDMTGQTTTEVLRYGYASWFTDCAGDWDPSTTYGRICVSGTNAPFFNAFAATGDDYCVQSTDSYYAMACTSMHMFTIAVR